MGDTSGDTQPAPLRRPQGDRHSQLDSRHRRRRQADRPVARVADPVRLVGHHRQAALPRAALPAQHAGPGIHNWGWAIIIVTVIFNLVLLPTRIMMMKSSLKMMRIQPKVEALKKQYANLKINDPKRAEMNTEMMALYKTEGVNMYGGCLPLLLQMPLFFAYYPRAAERGGAAPGALVLAHRSVVRRSAAHSADPHHRHHVPDAVHHAVAGHGPGAAPHDGHHDAGHHRLHPVALRLGTGALLGHRQHHQPGHAGGHQPVQDRQGDARDRRTPRRNKKSGGNSNPRVIQGRR